MAILVFSKVGHALMLSQWDLLLLKFCVPKWVGGMVLPPKFRDCVQSFLRFLSFPSTYIMELAPSSCFCHPAGIFNRPNKFATKGKSILIVLLMRLIKVPFMMFLSPLDHNRVELLPKNFSAGCKQVHGTKGESILAIIAGCRRFFLKIMHSLQSASESLKAQDTQKN